MKLRPVLSALLDLGVGLVAIVLVVGVSIAVRRVSDDFRVLFALNAVAFFVAGFLRSSTQTSLTAWKTFRLSAPGLLGIAALIVNNGQHRLMIPISLAAGAVAACAGGLYTRSRLRSDLRSGAAFAAGSLAAIVLTAVLLAPFLSGMFAFERQHGNEASFTLALDAKPLSSDDLRGRVAVLAYFTSWCSPCARELPNIQSVYQRFRNEPGVVFYAVDLNWNNETPEKGHAFLEKRHLILPMAFDSGKAAETFKIDGVPALILIDKRGAVRFKHFGYDGAENLEANLTRRIQNLLQEQ